MGALHAVHLLLLIILLVQQRSLSALESGSNDQPKWLKPGVLTHQSLHLVLVNMEKRLRDFEEIKFTTIRMDHYLYKIGRQLDSLDVRTRSAQIKLEQLETVAQNLVSHQMKNDLSTEHLKRKFETNQDRLIHKITLTENRLDSSMSKFQGTLELGFEKIDKKQSENESKFNSISIAIEDISNRLKKIEDHTNSTIHTIQMNKISGVEHSHTRHMDKIAEMLEGIENHVNRSLMLSEQSDSPNKNKREDEKRIKEIIRTELHSEANKIGNKINNMYDGLWDKTVSIEALIKYLALSANQTNTTVNQHNPSRAEDIQCSETIESVLREMLNTLGSALQEKLDSVDSGVDGIFNTHKMLLGTYNKMRVDEKEFEEKLTYVLGKILDTIENRTRNVDESQKKTYEALKSHNNQVVRTVAYNTNFLRKLAEDTGLEHKNLENTLIRLLHFMASDKNDSQEYEDITDIYKKKHNEEKEIVETTTRSHPNINQTKKLNESSMIVAETNHNYNSKSHNEREYRNPVLTFNEETTETTTDFEDSHFLNGHHTSQPIEDENDRVVTKLLMLYLKALKGHLSKEKFLYEANPQQPYSSVQEMVKKLKEKNFPSDFLRELEEWDNETNEKEVLEEMTEAKEFIENHGEDYYPDKDYLDYPAKDDD